MSRAKRKRADHPGRAGNREWMIRAGPRPGCAQRPRAESEAGGLERRVTWGIPAPATRERGPRAPEGPRTTVLPGGETRRKGSRKAAAYLNMKRAGGGRRARARRPASAPGAQRSRQEPPSPGNGPRSGAGARTPADRAALTLGGPCRSRLQEPGREQRVRSRVTW